MDPITGAILGVIFWSFSLIFAIVLWPFRKINEIAGQNPRRTAKMVLGAIAAGIFSYLFGLPYVIEFSVAGGIVGLILDMAL
jgi:hypothetical protein